VPLKLVAQESEQNKALENPGAGELMDKWGGAKSGLPFLVFLNGKREKIADSNRLPGGKNIGCPSSAEEIAEFDRLLHEAAPGMAQDQRARLSEHFRALHEQRRKSR